MLLCTINEASPALASGPLLTPSVECDRCMPISLGQAGFDSIASVWMYSKVRGGHDRPASGASRCSRGCHRCPPQSRPADRAAADDRENEISENFKVAPGDTDVLELDRACGECYRDDRLRDPDSLKSSDRAANGQSPRYVTGKTTAVSTSLAISRVPTTSAPDMPITIAARQNATQLASARTPRPPVLPDSQRLPVSSPFPSSEGTGTANIQPSSHL